MTRWTRDGEGSNFGNGEGVARLEGRCARLLGNRRHRSSLSHSPPPLWTPS